MTISMVQVYIRRYTITFLRILPRQWHCQNLKCIPVPRAVNPKNVKICQQLLSYPAHRQKQRHSQTDNMYVSHYPLCCRDDKLYHCTQPIHLFFECISVIKSVTLEQISYHMPVHPVSVDVRLSLCLTTIHMRVCSMTAVNKYKQRR